MSRKVEVNVRDGGLVIVLIPMEGGGWAAILEPGWTEFGETPEAAVSNLWRKYGNKH